MTYGARLMAGLFTLLLAACSGPPVGNPHVPEPAKSVQLSRYTGLWYEMARYENGFEKGCEAVTARYEALDNGLIGITNSCREGSVSGSERIATGKAKIVAASRNAKLKVSFFGPFYVGDYWVLDHAADYSWSVVGEPSGRYLWILTRAAHPTDSQKTALYDKAKSLGYDTTLLRATAH